MTSLLRLDGSLSIKEPEPSDPGPEEPLPSPTSTVKDSTLEEQLLSDYGEERFTRDSESMEETEETSETTEESALMSTEDTTTMAAT